VLALAVASYGAERSLANRSAGPDQSESSATAREWLARLSGVAALGLGALLFAGSLAEGGHEPWPGLIAGAACAAAGYLAVATLFSRARRRLEPSAATLLPVYADGVALALAALAIFLQPVSFLALAAFVLLVLGGRRAEGRKYAGLRILR
jgi:hypothetical protein